MPASVELLVTDGGCWVRRTGHRRFAEVPVRWNPARRLGTRSAAAEAAVADVVRAALSTLRLSSVAQIRVIHPTHWGNLRIAQLRAGAAPSCRRVRCEPFAARLVRQRGPVVLAECGELATFTAVVEPNGVVLEPRYDPDLGTADVESDGDAVKRFAPLLRRNGIDRVVITGTSGPLLDRVAAAAHPMTATVLNDPDALTAARKPAVVRTLSVAAAVVLAVAAVSTFLFVRRAPEPYAASIGPVDLVVPGGWSVDERPAQARAQRRVDLRPDGDHDVRIILTQNAVTPTPSLEEARQQLDAQIPLGSMRFSTSRVVTFGDRDVVHYVEKPGDDSEIRWYTVVTDGAQTGVGCQYRPGGWPELERVCAAVVESIDPR